MPYTPPSVQSPVASRPNTPSLSRTHSYNKDKCKENEVPSQSSQSNLARSSSHSYLHKHRRSPSTVKTPSFTIGSSTSDAAPLEKSLDNDDAEGKSHSFEKKDKRGSPPNISPDASPSASPPSSGDDETSEMRGRKRNVTNLAELQAAIKIIEQHRGGSPDEQACEETTRARMALGLPPSRLNISKQSQTGNTAHPPLSPRLPLSAGARKISHSRSTTDATAFFDFPRNKFDSPSQSTSQSDDEEVEDDELRIKPALIRKKSGELVRPALRASSTRRRPVSMPGTPTYSKAVHFQDNSLEHVRLFLQVDRPIAVSAGSSPVDPHDDDVEYPFGGDASGPLSPPFDWEIQLTNFPRDSIDRQTLPVRTEKVYLSADSKVLLGCVAVRNLAFHKQVVARFTLDYWKTTSEVVAEYNHDVRRKLIDDGCDRFTFSIKLEDQANLENKTMFFCVRYHVNGRDYWDNNNKINYQVDFSKKFKPQLGKQGAQAKRPLDTLPRNKPSASFSPRPRSMPSFDDFADMASPYEFTSFPQPSAIVGDSPIRFKNKPSATDVVSDAPGKPKSSGNQAFGNRYDFGASLSAAMQPASNSIGSSKEDVKRSVNAESEAAPAIKVQPDPEATKPVKGSEVRQPNRRETPKPAALTSEKPSLSSSSYHELLDKYCFVRSGPNTETTQLVR